MPSKYARHWAWIITGPNGAGKSSCRNSLSPELRGLPCIDIDQTAENICRSSGVYPATEKETIELYTEVGRINRRQIGEHFDTGESFLVERVVPVLPMQEHFREYGWKIGAAIVALATPELSQQRVDKRVSEGGHPVGTIALNLKEAWDISAHRAASFLQTCDDALIFDNSGDAPLLVASKKGGFSYLSLTLEGMRLLRSGENKYLETVIYESGHTLSMSAQI